MHTYPVYYIIVDVYYSNASTLCDGNLLGNNVGNSEIYQEIAILALGPWAQLWKSIKK